MTFNFRTGNKFCYCLFNTGLYAFCFITSIIHFNLFAMAYPHVLTCFLLLNIAIVCLVLVSSVTYLAFNFAAIYTIVSVFFCVTYFSSCYFYLSVSWFSLYRDIY